MESKVRHITVKSLFNADEFIEFERACTASDTPQSRILRDLAKHWSQWVNRTDRTRRRERAGHGQNMAMFTSRRGGAPIPMRL